MVSFEKPLSRNQLTSACVLFLRCFARTLALRTHPTASTTRAVQVALPPPPHSRAGLGLGGFVGVDGTEDDAHTARSGRQAGSEPWWSQVLAVFGKVGTAHPAPALTPPQGCRDLVN